MAPAENHDHLGLAKAAPIVPGGRATGIRIPVEGAGQPGVVRLEQMRAVDERQLTRQLGAVDGKTLTTALAALREMFAEEPAIPPLAP